jgi:hypothetical protein
MSDPNKKKRRKKAEKAKRRALADELDKRGHHSKEDPKQRKNS